jgi:hypothetical protein
MARLKFRSLNPLHVWKFVRLGIRRAAALHNPMGIGGK